jgi:hypothetical protein
LRAWGPTWRERTPRQTGEERPHGQPVPAHAAIAAEREAYERVVEAKGPEIEAEAVEALYAAQEHRKALGLSDRDVGVYDQDIDQDRER